MYDSHATLNVPQVKKEYSPVQISVAGATDKRMYTEFDVAVTTTFSFLHNRRIPDGIRRLCFVGSVTSGGVCYQCA